MGRVPVSQAVQMELEELVVKIFLGIAITPFLLSVCETDATLFQSVLIVIVIFKIPSLEISLSVPSGPRG